MIDNGVSMATTDLFHPLYEEKMLSPKLKVGKPLLAALL
jgi:hypothetical protein